MASGTIKMCNEHKRHFGYCQGLYGHEGPHQFPASEHVYTQSEMDAAVAATEARMRALAHRWRTNSEMWDRPWWKFADELEVAAIPSGPQPPGLRTIKGVEDMLEQAAKNIEDHCGVKSKGPSGAIRSTRCNEIGKGVGRCEREEGHTDYHAVGDYLWWYRSST